MLTEEARKFYASLVYRPTNFILCDFCCEMYDTLDKDNICKHCNKALCPCFGGCICIQTGKCKICKRFYLHGGNKYETDKTCETC